MSVTVQVVYHLTIMQEVSDLLGLPAHWSSQCAVTFKIKGSRERHCLPFPISQGSVLGIVTYPLPILYEPDTQ